MKATTFDDIIEVVLPYLTDTKDFFKLSVLNKKYHQLLLTYYQNDLYELSFGHDPTELAILGEVYSSDKHSWLDLYSKRVLNAQLYSWGSMRNSRLGYTVQNFDLSIAAQKELLNGLSHRGTALGVNAPCKVPFGKNMSNDYSDSIVDLSSGGFSIQLITANGKLYSTGQSYHGGNKFFQPADGQIDHGSLISLIRNSNVHITKLLGRYNTPKSRSGSQEDDQIVDRVLNECLGHNPYVKRMVSRSSLPEIFYDKCPSGYDGVRDVTKFTKVSSGRCHFLALGEDSNVFIWDGPDTIQGIKLVFVERDGIKPADYPVRDIKCGWDFSSCHRYGLGIMVWRTRDAVNENDKFFATCSDYEIVPNTEDVSEYVALQDGRCAYVDKKTNSVHVYHKGETKMLVSNDVERIQGFKDKLAIFTKYGKVSTCTVNGPEMKDVRHIEIPGVTIESVQFGDYHVILLSSRGKLYSFGLESQQCGSLGLGSPARVCSELKIGYREGYQDIRVTEPQLITHNLSENYTCIKLTTGGWQSSAVIM